MISGFIECVLESLLVCCCRSLWKQICQYGCQYVTICDQYATKIPCGKCIFGLLRKWVGKWIGGIIGERQGRSLFQRFCRKFGRGKDGPVPACLDV